MIRRGECPHVVGRGTVPALLCSAGAQSKQNRRLIGSQNPVRTSGAERVVLDWGQLCTPPSVPNYKSFQESWKVKPSQSLTKIIEKNINIYDIK